MNEWVESIIASHETLVKVCRAWLDYMDSDLSEAEKRLVERTKQAIAQAKGVEL